MGKIRPFAVTISICCLIGAARARAQEAQGPERAGPEVQAEGQDVPGGLEPEPAESFSPENHLLGDLFGNRQPLADHGISIDPVLTADYVKNFHGGKDTEGSAFLHAFDLYFTIESEPLLGFAGGRFYADLLTQHGQSPEDEVGDFATVSDIDYGGRTQVNEIWYEQKFLTDKLRIKLGKIDANTEFCVANNSFDFSNGGLNYGFPRSQSRVMPTVPDNAWGGVLFVYPTDAIYAGVGVFDGALHEGYSGDYGPSTLFGPPADLYLSLEVGYRFKLADNPWRVAAGASHHTGTFAEFDGGTQDGNNAFYAVIDGKIWRENPEDEEDQQGLGAFFVYDTSDSNVSIVDQHFAGGIAWTGAIPGRDDDVTGIGASYSHLGAGSESGFVDTGELAAEVFYKLVITKYLSVKADLQYIKDPGGTGLDDALAALVRVQIAF